MGVTYKNPYQKRRQPNAAGPTDFHDGMPLPGGNEGPGPNAAVRGGQQLTGLRRPYPGTVCVRVDRYEMQDVLGPDGKPALFPVKGPDGRPAMGPGGKPLMEPRQAAVGFYGTTTCSHEQIYMRLCTDEEQMADGRGHVSSNRRTLNVIRTGANDQSVRGRHGELMTPELLPEAQRPIFRCDNVMPVTDQSGAELQTPDGCRQYRTSWITAICNFQDREGNQVNMLDHVERDAWSTVDLNLSRGKDGSPDYRAVFRNAVQRCAGEGKDKFTTAAFAASKDVLATWKKRQQETGGRAEPFAFLNVTTWRPEKSIRIMPGDDPEAAKAKLQALLEESQYQDFFRVNKKTGMEELAKSPMRPSFIVRLLDEKGAVCGTLRVNDYRFARDAAQAREAGDEAAAASYETPAGRAEHLVNILDTVEVTGGDKPVGIDILPGDSCFVSQNVTTPGHFGQAAGVQVAVYQAQQLVQLGLEHGALPVRGRREGLGCSQLFVTRTESNVVTGVFKTKDGGRYRNACLLGPNGTMLSMTPAYRKEVEEEIAKLQKYGPALEAEASQSAGFNQELKEPAFMQQEPPAEAYEEDFGPRP